MVELRDTNLYRKVKNGEASNAEIADYLLKNYTTYALALAMAEVLMTDINTEPIVISEEAFRAHFRIKGRRKDDSIENRGRVVGTKVVNGKVILPENVA